MSYKTELQSNNVDLQGILDKVNALPEMEEAPELPTLSNPAAAAQILSGYEVLDQHGIKLTGIMEDNGAVSQSINAGGSYTIPAGYHNGSGKVTGNNLASQTSATAAAADIASGKTAWVNGELLTGSMENVLSGKTFVGTLSFNYPNVFMNLTATKAGTEIGFYNGSSYVLTYTGSKPTAKEFLFNSEIFAFGFISDYENGAYLFGNNVSCYQKTFNRYI